MKWAALAIAVIGGLMLADILTHPRGVRAAGGEIVGLEKNTGNQLLGNVAR